MDIVHAGQPVCDLLKLCYHANRSPLLEGNHGVGKSELVEVAASRMGIGFISRDLSLMEPPDLIGLPKAKGAATTYLAPEFLPRVGQGLFLLEELNRAPAYMRAPCLQLLTARRLNDYKLPEGWLPVATVNPGDGEYDVAELDPALTSRFVQVRVVPDQQEWLEWASRSGVHEKVIEYVASDPTVFDHADSNPRAWKYVSDLVKAAEQHKVSPVLLRAGILGQVGDARGSAFLRSWDAGDCPLAASEVLADFRQQQVKFKRWVRDGRLDLVRSTLLSVLKHLQPQADYTQTRETRSKWANLSRFFYALPGDLLEEARQYFEERNYEFPRRLKKPPLKRRKSK